MRTVVYLLLILGLSASFGVSASDTFSGNPINTRPTIILVSKKEKNVNRKPGKENFDYRIDMLRENFHNTTIAKISFHRLIDEAMKNSSDGTEFENLYDQIGLNNDQFRFDDILNPFIGYVVEHYSNNIWAPTVITQLLAHGANLNRINPETGHAPLHVVVYKQHTELVELLIAYKANPNIANNDGQTPLHFACMTGNLGMVELLIENGADVDARDNKYAASTHFVVGRSLSKAMPSLLKFPNQRKTQLMNKYLSQIETRKKIIDVLYAKNVDFEPIDTDNKTPYDIACQEGHFRLASYIENKKQAAFTSSATAGDDYSTSSTDEEDNNKDY